MAVRDEDIGTVVTTPQGDVLASFGYGIESPQEFHVVAFLDAMVDGTPVDLPDMENVDDVDGLSRLLEKRGMSPTAAATDAARLWASASIPIRVEAQASGMTLWREVRARPITRGVFEILGAIPTDEVWRFSPGAIVRCEPRRPPGENTVLVAVDAYSDVSAGEA